MPGKSPPSWYAPAASHGSAIKPSAGRMEGRNDRPELGVLLTGLARTGRAIMGREEPEWHVAPVVAVGRIELEHRHELHDRHAELDEVRDLLDEPGVRSTPLFLHPRARVGGEGSHVELVHDRVRLVARVPVVTPIEGALRGAGDEQADGRPPGVRPGPSRGLPV